MITINNQDRVILNQELLQSEIDGETIMMSIDNGKYYGLNTVASRIWEIIKDEPLFAEIVEKLVTEYDIDKTQCEKETKDFLIKLIENKLIKLEE
jgi:hypothetical protein